MDLKISFHLNEKLFLRDPESSKLGQRIIQQGIVMLPRLGFEAFTFKKLAEEIHTTEASIYRYFENKHRLLLYVITLYWRYLEYHVILTVSKRADSRTKISDIIHLLTHELDVSMGQIDFDTNALYNIIINESSKAYFLKDVDEHNKDFLYKPYKDVCARIADLFLELNPNFPFPHSLASTIIEAAHFQHFFAKHLPRLTDIKTEEANENSKIQSFLEHLAFASLA